MSHEPPETLTPGEARARDALRQLPRPEADPAFRARLKREFVSGSITSLLGDAARRAAGAGSGRVVRGPWAAWAPRLAWAAAAAAIVAASVLAINHGPRWQVSGVTGSGIAVVGQRPIPLEHVAELAQALRPGLRIQVPPGASLELTAPGTLMIQVAAGTEMVLPESPGRWFGRRVTAEVRRGELRITTGASFHGARLAVNTPEARVEVTGTTLAVICEPMGTCVCALEGRVGVAARGASMEMVTGGHRRFVFNDGRPPEMAEMRATERAPLGELRQRAGNVMERR